VSRSTGEGGSELLTAECMLGVWEVAGCLGHRVCEVTARSEPSGHCMYLQFKIQQLYVLPTQCIYVFCVDLRTNSGYFPIQH
jgi:hypothetical protein